MGPYGAQSGQYLVAVKCLTPLYQHHYAWVPVWTAGDSFLGPNSVGGCGSAVPQGAGSGRLPHSISARNRLPWSTRCSCHTLHPRQLLLEPCWAHQQRFPAAVSEIMADIQQVVADASAASCWLQVYLLKLCVLIWNLLWTVPAALGEGQRSRLIKPPARDWLVLQWSPLAVLVGLLGYVSSRRIVVRGCFWCLGVFRVQSLMFFLFAMWCWRVKIEKPTFVSVVLFHPVTAYVNMNYCVNIQQLYCQHTGWKGCAENLSCVKQDGFLNNILSLMSEQWNSVGIKHDVISHLSFWATWIYPLYVYTPSPTLQFSIFYYFAF